MFIRAEQAKTSDRGLTPAFVADRMNPGRGLQSFPLVAVLSVGADGAAFFIWSEKRPSDISDSRKSAHQIVGKTTVSYRSKNNRVIDSAIASTLSIAERIFRYVYHRGRKLPV